MTEREPEKDGLHRIVCRDGALEVTASQVSTLCERSPYFQKSWKSGDFRPSREVRMETVDVVAAKAAVAILCSPRLHMTHAGLWSMFETEKLQRGPLGGVAKGEQRTGAEDYWNFTRMVLEALDFVLVDVRVPDYRRIGEDNNGDLRRDQKFMRLHYDNVEAMLRLRRKSEEEEDGVQQVSSVWWETGGLHCQQWEDAVSALEEMGVAVGGTVDWPDGIGVVTPTSPKPKRPRVGELVKPQPKTLVTSSLPTATLIMHLCHLSNHQGTVPRFGPVPRVAAHLRASVVAPMGTLARMQQRNDWKGKGLFRFDMELVQHPVPRPRLPWGLSYDGLPNLGREKIFLTCELRESWRLLAVLVAEQESLLTKFPATVELREGPGGNPLACEAFLDALSGREMVLSYEPHEPSGAADPGQLQVSTSVENAVSILKRIDSARGKEGRSLRHADIGHFKDGVQCCWQEEA